MKKSASVVLLVGAIVGLVSMAEAVLITGDGIWGDYSADFVYNVVGSTGALHIDITNENSTSAGGKLTGFVFNYPDEWKLTNPYEFSYSLEAPDYGTFVALNNESASPYETFDLGAALDGNFSGGGSPNGGITIGKTGSFTFTFNAISGDNIDFTEADFLSVYSGSNENTASFLVRFKGFDNDASDKVPGESADPTPVPEPVSFLLVASACAGLLFVRRTR